MVLRCEVEFTCEGLFPTEGLRAAKRGTVSRKAACPAQLSLGEKIGGKIGLEDGAQKINRCPATL
jgi:hypothetical protein